MTPHAALQLMDSVFLYCLISPLSLFHPSPYLKCTQRCAIFPLNGSTSISFLSHFRLALSLHFYLALKYFRSSSSVSFSSVIIHLFTNSSPTLLVDLSIYWTGWRYIFDVSCPMQASVLSLGKSILSFHLSTVKCVEECLSVLVIDHLIKSLFSKHDILFAHFSDDPGAIHPCSPAKPPPPARSFRMQCPSLPSSRHLWVEKEMFVLLYPSSTCHNDCQPGTHHLDSQSHELHSGKRLLHVHVAVPSCYIEFAFKSLCLFIQRVSLRVYNATSYLQWRMNKCHLKIALCFIPNINCYYFLGVFWHIKIIIL